MRRLGDWIPPLVQRDLMGYSRKPWTYWLRFLTTLGGVGVLMVIGIIRHDALGQNDGFWLFASLAIVLSLIVSITGLRSTADSVSRERREGTLGLLFLTDLRLATILFSKLVSHSIQNACALLAVLPVLGICVLLGGVSGRMFLQAILAILAGLGLSLVIGLKESCAQEDDHLAFSAGLRRLLLFNLLPFVSPFSLLIVSIWPFRGYLYYSSTLFFIVLLCGYYWQEAQKKLAQNWQRHGSQGAVSGPTHVPPAVGHLQHPTKLCGPTDPALWIISRYGDFRQASPSAIAWVFLYGFVAIVLVMVLQGVSLDLITALYLVMMGGGRFAQLLAMGKIAPQSFAEITAHGALEILQTTPVTLRELVRAARFFLVREFRRGLVPMLIFDLGMAALIVVGIGWKTEEGRRYLLILLLQQLWFFAALPAAGLTGIWAGLRCGSFSRAAFRTTLLVVILPLLALFLRHYPIIVAAAVAGYALLIAWMLGQLRRLMASGERLAAALYH